jgi:acyl transferase domain-containing protein
VGAVAVVPGTALFEWVVQAGDRVGCDVVEELTFEVPLAVAESGGVAVQVVVGVPDGAGRREVAVHARVDDESAGSDEGWIRHAHGVITRSGPADRDGAAAALRTWPPAGAVAAEFDADAFYAGLAEAGLVYGAGFRGLRTVWRRGEELFAEIALPESLADVDRFGIHPALLDAALQVAVFGAERAGRPADAVRVRGGAAAGHRRVGRTGVGTARRGWVLRGGRRPVGGSGRCRGVPGHPGGDARPGTGRSRSRRAR